MRQRPRRLADVAAAPRGRDRLARAARSPPRSARGPTGPCRARRGPRRARGRPAPAPPARASQRPADTPRAAWTGDEAELAADLARDLAVAAGLRERERLVQHRRALLVAAADGVHERDAERRQRPGEQRRVADAARLRARLAQAGDARLDGAGVDRRAARVELPDGGRAVAGRRRPLGVRRRPAHARIGRAPAARAGTAPRRPRRARARRRVARPRQAAHQQLVGAVVVAVERERARREGGGRRAGRRPPAPPARRRCSTASHTPAKRRRSTSSHASKSGPAPGIDALEQLAAGRARGPGAPAASASTSTAAPVRQLAARAGRPRSASGSPSARRSWASVQRSAPSGSSASPKIRPASRVRATGRSASARYAEHRPRLVPARRSDGHAVALDLRPSQQADRRARSPARC